MISENTQLKTASACDHLNSPGDNTSSVVLNEIPAGHTRLSEVFNAIHPQDILYAMAAFLKKDLANMGHELEIIDNFASEKDLPFPTGPNVVLLMERIPGLSAASLWAAINSDKAQGTNILLTLPYALGFGTENTDRLYITAAVFIDKERKLRYGIFTNPLQVDAVAYGGLSYSETRNHLEECGIPQLNNPAAIQTAMNKDVFHAVMSSAGFAQFLPPTLIVPGKESQINLEEIQAFFADHHDREIVIKPANGSLGKNVKMFKQHELPQALEYIEKLRQSSNIIVQARIIPKEWKDPQTENLLDWNIRVLSTWSEDKVIINPEMIEIRYRVSSNSPVNLSTGATAVTFQKFSTDYGLTPQEQDEMFISIHQLVSQAAHLLEAKINGHGKNKATGLLGWDLMIDSNNRIFIIEVNAGSVGGIKTIEALLPPEKKLDTVSPIIGHFISEAVKYRSSNPANGEDKIQAISWMCDELMVFGTAQVIGNEHPDESEKIFKSLIENPVSAGNRELNYIGLAISLFQQKRFVEAEQTIRQTMSLGYVNKDVYEILVRSLHNQRKYEECEKAAKEAISAGFSTEMVYKALIVSLHAQNKTEELESTLYEARDLGFKNVVSDILGDVLTKRKAYEQAEHILRSALKFEEISSNSYINLSIALLEQKKYDEARQFFNDWLKDRLIDPSFFQKLNDRLSTNGENMHTEFLAEFS